MREICDFDRFFIGKKKNKTAKILQPPLRHAHTDTELKMCKDDEGKERVRTKILRFTLNKNI